MRLYQLFENTEHFTSAEFDAVRSAGVQQLDKLFTKNGYTLRIVGGAVRDLLIGRQPKDIDLATDATPDEMIKFLKSERIRVIPTGLQHGTITAVIDGEQLEITTLRADTETDGRHAKVEFIRSWEEDAKRRDLTYNAMSLDMDGTLYDYYGGADDLQDKVSKFVGDADNRIKEDYLRILRYFRFQGKIDSPSWDKDTLQVIKDNASGLSQISGERIWMELAKILTSDNAGQVLVYMDSTEVLNKIMLPTIDMGDVKNLKRVTKNNPILALALLIDNDNDARKVIDRFKLSNTERDILQFIVTNKSKNLTLEIAIAHAVDGIPLTIIKGLAIVVDKPDIALRISKLAIPQFPIQGKDLIQAGIKPGPDMGKLLNTLRDKWKESNYSLTKDELISTYVEKIEK